MFVFLCLVHTFNSPGKKFHLRSLKQRETVKQAVLHKEAGSFLLRKGCLTPLYCSLAFICSRVLEQWVFGKLFLLFIQPLCNRSISAAYHVRSFIYLAFLQPVCKWMFIMHEKSFRDTVTYFCLCLGLKILYF